ncbi:ABC-2 transporter permease [Listeria grandensis]|uniref:ABC-2 transporter permease n=1 Tax=Listeria grandensis TaxID=1494963 RepID=UPI001625E1D0|nr:ABC-2 transporter permease [Listeria grandensis]MBC1474625.1 ABC-2 transporter permease [Listeria grandensis]
MWQLIWKDVMIQRGSIIWRAILLIFIVIFGVSIEMPAFIFLLLGTLIAGGSVIARSISRDEGNHTLLFLTSLPVSRKDIVMARYIGTLIVMLVTMVFLYVITSIVMWTWIPIEDFFVSMGTALVIVLGVTTLLFPIYYWFGYDLMRYVGSGLIIFYAFLTLLVSLPIVQKSINWLAVWGYSVILSILLGLMIVLYIVSMRFSIRVLGFTDL